ncbi:uncharacterized protein LOC121581113 isoform X2 [Coregonus clupeaformis]|uniref:uncharacterized protein LOC121581113 isoform X2 n=1 Tax=Coregonus clupeaformis TaxID=59861 RepID=UPI001E1C9869|nr:uncharacterized protein LOC121581113 isoform X2 [Coregonus clupeaformis]
MGQTHSDPVTLVSPWEQRKETHKHKNKPKKKSIPPALTFLQLCTLLSCVRMKKTPFDPSQSGEGRKATTIHDTNNNNDSDTGSDYSEGDVKRIKHKSKRKVSPVEKAKETKQKEKKQSIYPAVAALQLFTLFCCGGKVKLKKTRASQYRQSKKDQDEDTASDTGSDWSGGDVTTKKVKDKSNGKANQRTPRQVKTHVEEIYIRPDSPTLPRAHSSLSQFSQARNLAILPLEWQLPGVPMTTSSMATRTERKPSTTNTSTQAQTETQTTDMNTDTQTTATSQRQISMVTTQSSETMTEVHTSDSSTQNSTPDMALTPESTKDMIATDEDVKDDSAEDLISTLTDTSMEKSVQ